MDQIKYIDRKSGKEVVENPPGAGFLKFLYNHPFGKLSLNLLFKRKLVSTAGGWFMSGSRSAKRIEGFINQHKMDLSDYLVPEGGYKTFNDFFYRKICDGARPLGSDFVSPADGKIIVFNTIDRCTQFFVKGSSFNISDFLNSKKLAEKYEGGGLAIIRLAPTDYHRYHFPASGKADPSVKIKGPYYSVSPLALKQSVRILLENKREYTILKTSEYGDVVICDVGATMVGSIHQTYKANSDVKKGEEKGYFAFGGSTLVILIEKDKVKFDEDLIGNTQNGMETAVRMGETIAKSI